MISYVSGCLMIPSWWIPASCANAFAPTIALFGATCAPVISVSMRLVGKSSSSRMPVVTPKLSLRTPKVFANSSEHCSVFFRHRISHGVRQIQDRCARIYRHTAHLTQKIDVRSPSILGGELHFAHMLPAVANHRADGFERLLPGHVQLHTKVQIGGCEEDMEARRGRRFQSFYCGAYIFLLGACECRNRHRPNFLRYLLNRFQVAPRRNRETRFDHVNLQRRKLPR